MNSLRPDPPAVLLGGRGTAVWIARRLGEAGVEVHALGRGHDPVRLSRYCAGFGALGDGEGSQERWLEWLRTGPRGAVLLPCADEGLQLVADRNEELRELGYRLPEGDPAVMRAMLDKTETYALGRKIGLATPRTFTLSGLHDAAQAAAEIGLPAALKPVHSHVFARHFPLKAVMVRDRAELDAAVADTEAAGVQMLLTEIVPGGDDQLAAYVSYVDEAGRPLLEFTSHKIRQFPNGFGLGSYVVNHYDDEVAQLGLRFIRGTGVRGPSYVEFKRDERDGAWKLLECNHRFTIEFDSFHPDAALLAFRRALGQPDPRLRRPHARTYQWDPEMDIQALISYWRRGVLSPIGWLRSFRFPLHLHVFRWHDPLPTIGYHAARVTRLVWRWWRETPLRSRTAGTR